MSKQYRVPVFKPDLPSDYAILEGYREIQKSGIVSNFGPFTQKFENIAKEYMGNDNVLAVNSCDSGLIMCIAAMNLPQGSLVAVPSFTFTSTVNAIKWCGHVPVFIDCNRETFNICVGNLREQIYDLDAAFGEKISLIVATHIFGNPCDIDGLNDLGIPIIFDAAHAYGSKYRGYKIGTHNTPYNNVIASVFSFSGTKLVTCGEGGLISTSSEMAEKIKYLRGYGFIGDYNCTQTGLNGKISEFNAMVGTNTLPTIDTAVMRRNHLVQAYKDRLGDKFKYQVVDDGDVSTYKDFAIICENKEQRDKIEWHLSEHGIQTKKYFMPLHMTDRYKIDTCGLPNTEWLYGHILCLPMFNALNGPEMDEICMIIERNM